MTIGMNYSENCTTENLVEILQHNEDINIFSGKLDNIKEKECKENFTNKIKIVSGSITTICALCLLSINIYNLLLAYMTTQMAIISAYSIITIMLAGLITGINYIFK